MKSAQDVDAIAPVEPEFTDDLRPGTQLLRGQYRVEQFLNAGGFGITYLARDSLDRVVVIKECFPSTICCRSKTTVRARSKSYQKDYEGIVRHFGQEARRLAKLQHPNIVGIHQVFEDNHTAYMALDYVRGQDLLDVIEDPAIVLSPDQVKDILLKVLDAIGFIHDRDILHRDISPDNILLDRSGNPVLIDFGAAREEATRASKVLSALLTVKDGYSPQEFYVAGSQQYLASDLYSLGATFYHVIVGEAPPHSQMRLAAIASGHPDPYEPLVDRVEGYSPNFLAAVDKAMQVLPQDRFQSAQEWIEEINSQRKVERALDAARNDTEIEKTVLELVQETNKAVVAEQKRDKLRKRAEPEAPPPVRKREWPRFPEFEPGYLNEEETPSTPQVATKEDEIVPQKRGSLARLFGRSSAGNQNSA